MKQFPRNALQEPVLHITPSRGITKEKRWSIIKVNMCINFLWNWDGSGTLTKKLRNVLKYIYLEEFVKLTHVHLAVPTCPDAIKLIVTIRG